MAEIDKRNARDSFGRAAGSYDEVAVLQREIGSRLLDRLQYLKIEPQRVLDLGAGTGIDAEALGKRFKRAEVIALDFAQPMLQLARRRGGLFRRPKCVCGDMERLPLADRSVDLIYSNAAIQWSNDLDRSFGELRRVLRPGGLLLFSTFGPDTLKELRAAWSAVDGHTHVSRFLDMHEVGDALVRCRFAEPVIDVDRLTLTYNEVGGLMRDLKALGAHNATVDRPRGLTGKGRLAAMRAEYERFRRDGRLPASYEVIYGQAWVPEREPAPGEVMVPIDRIGRR